MEVIRENVAFEQFPRSVPPKAGRLRDGERQPGACGCGTWVRESESGQRCSISRMAGLAVVRPGVLCVEQLCCLLVESACGLPSLQQGLG